MARASSTAAVPADISDALGEVSIFTAAGEPVQLKDLWDQQEGIAVVALLRHFGCLCCWELAASLKEAKEKFDSAGVKLIAVGVGTPDKAQLLAERWRKEFKLNQQQISADDVTSSYVAIIGLYLHILEGQAMKLQYEQRSNSFPMDSLYADPERKAYDVLGLYYGFRRTFLNPARIKVFSRYEELKKAMKNYTIKATPYDTSSVLQQGGMFVFKGKQLLYARKDEGTGDHAPLDEILDICCKVPTP
ncbi:hypothetical protein OROMI_006296 [Orobanche minor]